MLRIEHYDRSQSWSHNYRVRFDGGYRPAWVYPTAALNDDLCVLMLDSSNEYAAPPSHDLRVLIESAAPWFAVLDKLIEEYPQWEPHFAAAAAQMHATTEAA